jgi:hypothetical protein
MSEGCTFTVFTAAYNRTETLRRAYESLCRQTLRDFEWLIVDDGSGPAVRALVEQLQAGSPFPIRYIWQANQGKHAAHNRAVDEARGRYFVVLDDDDTCTPDALECFLARWNAISEAERSSFASILCLTMDQHGRLHGEPFPESPLDTDYLTLFFRLRVPGEKWGCYRTDVLRHYPYPVAPGPSAYMLEGVTWYRMARAYRSRCVNDVLRTWYVGHWSVSSPQARRLTDYRRIAPTQRIVHGQQIQEFLDFFGDKPRHFAWAAAHYGRFSLHAGVPLRQQWREAGSPAGRLLWLGMLPLAVALYGRDHWVTWRRRRAARPVPEARGTSDA